VKPLLAAALFALAHLGCSSDDTPAVTETAETGTPLCAAGEACFREGAPCDGKETCRVCGFESYVREAPRCLCKSGKWECTLTACGPFTPNTFVDPECKTRRDAGGPVDTGTSEDTGAGDTGAGESGAAETGPDDTGATAEAGDGAPG